MTNDVIKYMMEQRLAKDVVGARVSPTLYNISMQYGILMYVRKQCGLEEIEVEARPYWQKTRQVTDAIAPLLVAAGEGGVPYLAVDVNGYTPYPEGFYLFSSLVYPEFVLDAGKTKVIERQILDLTDEQFNRRLSSTRKQPTFSYPIATSRNGKIRFAPKGLKLVKMMWVRTPLAPFYDYNISGNRTIYLPPGTFHDGTNLPAGTPSRSVEVELHEKTHIDIANYALGYLATNLSDQLVIAQTEKQKSSGE